MTPANHPGGLLPPPPPGRDLPHHDRHRRELLAAIGSERAARRRLAVARGRLAVARGRLAVARGRLAVAWLAPFGAALAVLVLVAGVFALHGLLAGPARSVGTGRASSGPAATGAAATGGRPGQMIRRTERSAVSQAVTALAVQYTVGSVSITGADTRTVSIAAHLVYSPGDLVYRGRPPVITRQVTGGVLKLGYRCPAGSSDCGVNFDLVVPRGLPVTVRLGVGQIQLSGLAGPVSVHTGVGQIQGSGLSGPAVRLTTGTGMISAGFTAPPRQIVAGSGVGAVTLRVPAGVAYRVTATTQIGSVRVTVPRAATSGHVIQASTGAGAVTVARG